MVCTAQDVGLPHWLLLLCDTLYWDACGVLQHRWMMIVASGTIRSFCVQIMVEPVVPAVRAEQTVIVGQAANGAVAIHLLCDPSHPAVMFRSVPALLPFLFPCRPVLGLNQQQLHL